MHKNRSNHVTRLFRLSLPFLLVLAFAFVISIQLVLALTNQAKLTASPGNANDYAGTSVSIDGDTIVVGAPSCFLTISCAGRSGLAYVYVSPVSGWTTATQTITLTASDGIVDDYFGYAVSVSGDTIVVGARQADVGGNNDQGAAYVFVEPVGGWGSTGPTIQETVKLTASDGAANDEFGQSVAIDGPTIIVGAHQDDTIRGSAYIFEEPVGGWATFVGNESAKLTASDAANNSYFGQSVAIDGDTAVVGAWLANAQGQAYVFEEPVGGWSTFAGNESGILTASDGATNDQFGASVGISADTIVVGAWRDNAPLNREGSAYVFVEPVTGWANMMQDAKLTASDAATGDNLGNSVAIDGDLIVAGAPRDDMAGANFGSAYVYERPVTGWVTATETTKLFPSDGDGGDLFGWSVSINGRTMVGGALQDEDVATNAGSATVFFEGVRSVTDGNWTTPATWINNTVPVPTDQVTISAGDVVTVDVSVQVQSLVVEQDAALIIPNGVTLTVEDSVINNGTIQQISTINNGRVSLPLIQSSSNITRFVGTTLDTPNNLGDVTVTVRGLNAGEYCTQTGASSPAYAERCFEITATNNNTATVQLWALNSELGPVAPGALAVYRYETGTGWSELANRVTGNDGGNMVYAVGDTPGFSHFLLGQTGANNPTAVTLTAFTVHFANHLWLIIVALIALMTLAAIAYRHKQTTQKQANVGPVHNHAKSTHQ